MPWGDQFIGVLKTLHMLGLDNKEPVKVKDVLVAPRDVVAACLPDPAHLGESHVRKNLRGNLGEGFKDGKPRQVYIYQIADNQECMTKWGCQCVVAQTGFNPLLVGIYWNMDSGGQGCTRSGGLRSGTVYEQDGRIWFPVRAQRN